MSRSEIEALFAPKPFAPQDAGSPVFTRLPGKPPRCQMQVGPNFARFEPTTDEDLAVFLDLVAHVAVQTVAAQMRWPILRDIADVVSRRSRAPVAAFLAAPGVLDDVDVREAVPAGHHPHWYRNTAADLLEAKRIATPALPDGVVLAVARPEHLGWCVRGPVAGLLWTVALTDGVARGFLV